MTMDLMNIRNLDLSGLKELPLKLLVRAALSGNVAKQLQDDVKPLAAEQSQAVQTIYQKALADVTVFTEEATVIAQVCAGIGHFNEAADTAQKMAIQVYQWADENRATVNADTGEITLQNADQYQESQRQMQQTQAQASLRIGRTADQHLAGILNTANGANLTPEAVSGDTSSRVNVNLETLRGVAGKISELETSAGAAQTDSDIAQGGISSYVLGLPSAMDSAEPLHSFGAYMGNSWLKQRRNARTALLTELSSDLNTGANGFMRIDGEGAGRFKESEPHRVRN